jgi:hypothetical protein
VAWIAALAIAMSLTPAWFHVGHLPASDNDKLPGNSLPIQAIQFATGDPPLMHWSDYCQWKRYIVLRSSLQKLQRYVPVREEIDALVCKRDLLSIEIDNFVYNSTIGPVQPWPKEAPRDLAEEIQQMKAGILKECIRLSKEKKLQSLSGCPVIDEAIKQIKALEEAERNKKASKD